MALKLGAYTACLHDRPLEAALDVLGANGLTSVEVNTGGFIPSPHCHVDLLLASDQARADYLGEFSSRGMELTGLNCNGNPLNPLPGVGPKHADDLRRTIELAGLLGRPPPDLRGAIRETIAAGLLAEDGDRLRFRHDLVRDAVDASLPKAVRRSLRRTAIEVMRRHGS